ncbi:MAG: right-handed parallel beta-helix repeat-containing protein [Bacilli bacterium]
MPGAYGEDIIIDKPLTLLAANYNLNPAVDDEPFKADSDTAATITGVWTVNASNIKIKGFSFTGAARVKSYGPEVSAGFSNFRFENNYVYDTAEATIAWNESGHVTTGSSSADAAAPGFVSLYPAYTWLHNYQFINNKFSNVSDTHVFMVCVHNVTFKGNVFSGGDRDAIRLEYGANYGDFTFEDNVFENIAYNGIYLRSYVGSPYASDLVANIYNNTFKNVGGAAATESTERVRIGAIATRGYGETWSAYFNIKFNHFEDCANYISLRDNVTNYANWSTKGLTWLAVIEYNAFIDGDGVEFYFANLLAPDDTEATNTGNALINHNFYGSDAETKVDIEPEQFDYHREEESNTTVYETLAELLAAIEALDEEAE